MRIYNKLDEIFNRGSSVKILRFLFNNDAEFTGRAIARGSKLSVSYSFETLQDMHREGIVEVRRQGSALLYKLRKDSHIVKNILRPLYEKEKNIYKDITALIERILLKEKKGILCIAIFGSVASKTENIMSDMDLLIIAKDTAAKKRIDYLMDSLTIIMAKKFNLAIMPYILTVLEARNKYKHKVKLIKSIIDNNKLIYGEPIERILA